MSNMSATFNFPDYLDDIVMAFAVKSTGHFISLRDACGIEYFEDAEIANLFFHVNDYYKSYKKLPTSSSLQDFIVSETKLESNDARRIATKFDEIYSRSVEDSQNYSEFSFYFSSFKKRYAINAYERGLESSLSRIEDDEDFESAVRELETTVTKIRGTEQDRIVRVEVSDLSSLAIAKYEQIENNPDMAKGVLTGFSKLDEASNGLGNGELWLVVGSTGKGKSITLNSMSANIYNGINFCKGCKTQLFRINDEEMNCIYCGDTIVRSDKSTYDRIDGKNVAYVTIEMPGWSEDGPADVYDRLCAASTDLPIHDIQRGRLSDVHKESYKKYLKEVESYENKFFIIDVPRGVSSNFISGEIERNMCAYPDNPIDIVVVDYLNIMSANNSNKIGDSDWKIQGAIAEELHELARTYRIPVLTAAQATSLRDKSSSLGGGVGTHRIARGEMIAHNCNGVMQIEDDFGSSEMDHENLMKYRIPKCRGAYVKPFTMYKDFSRMQITNHVSLGASEYRRKLIKE